MRPMYQTSSIMLILGMCLLINSGCGKKHLHVSTMSGAPGEGELVMDLDNSGDQSGLGGSSGLDGIGLENQGGESAASAMDDLEPLDFTNDVAPLTQASASQDNEDLLAGLPSGTDSLNQGTGLDTPGQEIQSQSPTSTFTDDTSSLDGAGSDHLPPLTTFNDEGTASGVGVYDDLGIGNNDSALPVEQVPGNITIAKAEPSDAFRDQLDKIHAEERATLDAELNDVFFEFDSWNLTAEGRSALDQGAEWLNQKNTSRLLIEGHCDTRGTQAYNLVLGKKRAGAIRDYLVQLGITQDRVAIISYGQDKPFCSDQTEVCHQLNRRGHLLVQNP